jgi:antitoxin component of RelBE/YafQ-DinJ toxin-antitoxin module
MAKQQVNMRLDAKTIETIKRLQEELGMGAADVVSLAVRQLAKRELPKEPKEPRPEQ